MLITKKLIVKNRGDSRRYLQILKKLRRIQEIQGTEEKKKEIGGDSRRCGNPVQNLYQNIL